MDLFNDKRITNVLTWVTALVILLPFFIISAFNHPLGDDYWSTDLVRRQGFWHAQWQLYNTVPPRWLAMALTCMSPLSWGNFWGYKVIPVVFILLFIVAMAELFRTLAGGGSRSEHYGLAVLFAAIFLSAAPGIGEGIYWVSALIVFGVGLLLFIWWLNLLLIWGKGRRSFWVGAGLCFCFLGMAGSNEIITVVSVIVLSAVSIYKRRLDRMTLVQLGLFGLCVGFFICFRGVFNRYTLMQTSDSAKFWYSTGFSVLLSGFVVLKMLTSPFCLAAMIVAYPRFVRWGRNVYGIRRELPDWAPYFTVSWFIILFIIPFIVLYLSGLHPGRRVVNMIFFFVLIGLMYFGTLVVNGVVSIGFSKMPQGWRNIATPALLAAGFFVKNNVSVATRELLSGSAYLYDREMNRRYELIRECEAGSCEVPRLRHTSITLRYDSTDLNDQHISDYFQKEVLVR